MKVAIRVDVSSQIGVGHLMRTFALASHLVSEGAIVHYYCQLEESALKSEIKNHGINFYAIPPVDNHLPDENSDAQSFINAVQLAEGYYDWVIVDHYQLGAYWEAQVRSVCGRVMAIDDIANRQHEADILLDQNLGASKKTEYLDYISSGCLTLLGSKYTLLRAELRQAASSVNMSVDRFSRNRLLVCFGGADSENFTAKTCVELYDSRQQLPADIVIDVVVGSHYQHDESILLLSKKWDVINVHRQPSNFSELLSSASLAIGAGGSLTWERCLLGLPALAVCIADNQKEVLEASASNGCVRLLDQSAISDGTLLPEVLRLLANPSCLQVMAKAGRDLFDVNGVRRVSKAMSATSVGLREATADDLETVFQWRNHPKVTQWSKDGSTISIDTHRTWYTAALSNPNRILLIICKDGIDLGVVRLDVFETEYTLSIFLDPDKSGSGIGFSALLKVEIWIRKHFSTPAQISAHVLSNNIASNRLFDGAGFALVESEPNNKYVKEVI